MESLALIILIWRASPLLACLVKVIHDAIGWALTKDIDRLFSIMAQDDNCFIFHPDSKSTIVGFDAFKFR
jgi:hypothetical protein